MDLKAGLGGFFFALLIWRLRNWLDLKSKQYPKESFEQQTFEVLRMVATCFTVLALVVAVLGLFGIGPENLP